MDIRWEDGVTDLEVLDRAGLVSIEAMIRKAQLRWTGRMICMGSSRIPCHATPLLRQGKPEVCGLRCGRAGPHRPKQRWVACSNQHGFLEV